MGIQQDVMLVFCPFSALKWTFALPNAMCKLPIAWFLIINFNNFQRRTATAATAPQPGCGWEATAL